MKEKKRNEDCWVEREKRKKINNKKMTQRDSITIWLPTFVECLGNPPETKRTNMCPHYGYQGL